MTTTTFRGDLKLTLIDAKDLKDDHFGKHDPPYCNVSLGSAGLGGILDGQTLGKKRYKTKRQENGAWNESYTFDLQGMKPTTRLKIYLYDNDRVKEDYLGLVEITLKELFMKRDGPHYYELKENSKGHRVVGCIGLSSKFDCTQLPDSIREELTGEKVLPSIGEYMQQVAWTAAGKVKEMLWNNEVKEPDQQQISGTQINESQHSGHDVAADFDKDKSYNTQKLRFSESGNGTQKGLDIPKIDNDQGHLRDQVVQV